MKNRLFSMLLMMFTGWQNRHQQDMIEHLKEENKILREKLGGNVSFFQMSSVSGLLFWEKSWGENDWIKYVVHFHRIQFSNGTENLSP